MIHPVITVKQAAETLGLTERSVRWLIREHKLKASKFGRDWVVDARSLKHYASLPRKVGAPIKGKAIKADSIRRRRDRARAAQSA